MELDFDDLDIPISDANLSHLTSGSNSGNGNGTGGSVGLDMARKQGRSSTFDLVGEVDGDDDDGGGAVGLGTAGGGLGMMDWQSIDPGGECLLALFWGFGIKSRLEGDDDENTERNEVLIVGIASSLSSLSLIFRNPLVLSILHNHPIIVAPPTIHHRHPSTPSQISTFRRPSLPLPLNPTSQSTPTSPPQALTTHSHSTAEFDVMTDLRVMTTRMRMKDL